MDIPTLQDAKPTRRLWTCPLCSKQCANFYPHKKVCGKPWHDRFWAKVDKNGPNGCWIWTAAVNSRGYGATTIVKKWINAPRASWLATHGSIPEGKWVLHKCDVRRCVNPDHLYLGDAKDNANDMLARDRYNNQYSDRIFFPHLSQRGRMSKKRVA